jgi:hypothetical protein
MVMKHFIAVAGAAILLSCAASETSAQGRDSVERGTRMDTDALRDDVRTNRLQVPRHPLAVEQPLQLAPEPGAKDKSKKAKSSKAKSGRSGGSSQ